jgi:hypothetical protein
LGKRFSWSTPKKLWLLVGAVLLLLLLADLTGGLQRIVPVIGGRLQRQQPELLVYEKNGRIYAYENGSQHLLSGSGHYQLGPWSPDGRQLTLLGGLKQSSEWVSGYPQVLSLQGGLTSVVGEQGRFSVLSGELSWVNAGRTLAAATRECLWLADKQGKSFTAKARYTLPPDGGQQIWHPRGVPGGQQITFWVTDTYDDGGLLEARLQLLPVASGEPRTLFKTIIWAGEEVPVDLLWSPGGKQALVYVDGEKGLSWWLVDKQGKSREVLSADDTSPCWLNDRTLVFRSIPEECFRQLDTVTGKTSAWLKLPNWVEWLAVSPQGRLLLAKGAQNHSCWDLYTAEADGSSINLVTRNASDGSWQPQP